ncbi:DUF3237 domain-containing protein [Ramlibacter sp.]|uniref:DUF3237 domain-containing protein n=1 Tax=Ramlibacter sp. TaxID=1917967 RepID=UPI0035ADBC74
MEPTAALPAPPLTFFAHVTVQVGAPQEVGITPAGRRRVIPILGGTVRGDGWSGQVLPGGADFQRVIGDTLADLDARYVLETDEGERIYVANRALRAASAEVTAKLVRGEPVDPALVYFRCTPRFETASPRLAWIHERLFIGTGIRRPDAVEISFYAVG